MKNTKTLTNSLREILKSIMKDEITKIPELLTELEPLDRVNAICKLMPYVYPKVDNVNSCEGEPFYV